MLTLTDDKEDRVSWVVGLSDADYKLITAFWSAVEKKRQAKAELAQANQIIQQATAKFDDD